MCLLATPAPGWYDMGVNMTAFIHFLAQFEYILTDYSNGVTAENGLSFGGAGGALGGTATLLGLGLLVVASLIGAVVQARLKSVIEKYSAVETRLTGAETARRMLEQNGIHDVKVISVKGRLTDHYNPADKTVNLSETVYACNSIAAMAVAAHECGHAVQHATAYPWLGLRSSLVPVVNIGSRLGQLVLMAGLAMLALGTGPTVAWIGLALFAGTTVFALVTLPVEFNASARALAWLERNDAVNSALHDDARTALRWAAMTYVAGALSSLAMLLYYAAIILSRTSRRD